MKKLRTETTEADLLQARKEGLERARSLDAMQALGKWKSMDVFYWANPHFDALATVLSSFPFPVLWVGTQKQIKCALKYYPEVLDTIETVIVSNEGGVKLSGKKIYSLDKVAGAGDLESALKMVHSFEDARRVFLFTTEGDTIHQDFEYLNNFIQRSQ